MNCRQFTEWLDHVAPTVDEIVATGLSVDEAAYFRSTSRCQLMSPPPDDIEQCNQILLLIKHWNASSLNIGMVSFLRSPKPLFGGTQIGNVEADPLLMSAENQQFNVVELNTRDHILWKVAEDDRRLLDALATAKQFFNGRLTNKIDDSDNEMARRVAEECALLAGGSEYRSFYLMLVGAE